MSRDPRLVGLATVRPQERTSNALQRVGVLERRTVGGGGTGTVADATTTSKGKIQLAGDLEGTAGAPYLRKGTSTDSGSLGIYDLRRFGAVEGGDILAALQAAQTAMPAYGGEIHINLWRVNLSDTFTITKPIRIVGLGRGTYNRAEDLAGGAAFYNPTTIITWSGSAGGGPFFLTNGTSRPLGDVWFKNLACNGNNSATLVFDFDRTQDGGMENIIVKSLGATGVALRLRTARGESVTVQNAANTITLVGHGYSNGDVVYVSGTGVPGGLTAHTAYYVVGATTDTIQLALTAGGAAIDITTDGTAVILSDQPANQPHVHNTQNCSFKHLHFDCPLPIELLGGQGRQEITSQLWNVCLNHFEDVKIAYGWTDATGVAENTNGMDIWDGDNNTFVKFRSQHLGTGTGLSIDFHAAARSNYFFHVELEDGCRVRVPDSLSVGHLNHIEGYDRSNGEALPTIDAGARLRWTATGHSATGHWINAGQTAQINGATYYSLFVGGEISGQPRPNVEIVAKTYVNDSTASFDVVGNDAGTDVWGRMVARAEGDVVIGAASNHPVLFVRNAVEVFRINTSNQLEWGGDTVLYRGTADVLRTDDSFGINHSAGGAPAAAASGFYFNSTGAINIYKTTAGVVFRTYVATGAGTEAQPKFRISSTTNGADLEWGPGGSTAPDVNLFRTSGGALRTDDALEVGGTLTVVGISNLGGAVGASNVLVAGGSNTAFFAFNENAGNVAAGAQDTVARMYMTGNKLVVVFNDGGTTKYHYIDLTATTNQQWTSTTTPP